MPMLVTFLFWNLGKRPLQDCLRRIVSSYGVDLALLAECEIEPALLQATLERSPEYPFSFHPSPRSKIHIFSRFTRADVIPEFDDPIGGVTIRRLRVGRHPGINLAGIHLPGKLNWDAADQALEATALIRDVERLERQWVNDRTVLVGDLNMNPFDPGVTGAQALHAVMTRALAGREERDVRGRTYRMFYNPMWGHFGDRNDGPPGTYYLRSSKPGNYFWNMYDQVLLRPSLMHALTELRILDQDGVDPLVTSNGLPAETIGSDHLPILFRLDL
jgi:hypothetical protein